MITVERMIPWDDLEQRVRETPLLQQDDSQPVYPYEDATIRLEKIAYTDVSPTSLYVIRRLLAVQAAIGADLSAKGHHPLELEGGLLLKDEHGKETGLVPPIV